MALIKCYECNETVSDKADVCPHCGAPLKSKETNIIVLSSDAPGIRSNVIWLKSPMFVVVVGICIIVIVLLVIASSGAFVKGISITPSKLYISEGTTQTLQVDSRPSFVKTGNLNWETSDPSVVSVNDGIIVGKGEGTVVISANTRNGNKATCEVVSSDLLDEWEWDFCYIEGKKITDNSFKCYFNVNDGKCTFKDYLGDQYDGEWKYEETKKNVKVYSFDAQGYSDWLLTISDDSLSVSLDYTTDVVFFFHRK